MKTKKKKWFFCYVAVLLVILLIPSLGMTVAQSHWTTETTPLAEAPSFTKEDGSLNENILEDAGNYFEDHFAFRPELITINSMLQSTLLHTSSTDQILVGEDGWLGIVTGGFTASAAGIASAVLFGFLAALLFKPGEKR